MAITRASGVVTAVTTTMLAKDSTHSRNMEMTARVVTSMVFWSFVILW